MEKLTVGDFAPDFSLPDHEGTLHPLSKHYRQHNLLLVFNIGFA